jgi:hypothetical protein
VAKETASGTRIEFRCDLGAVIRLGQDQPNRNAIIILFVNNFFVEI